MTVTKSVGGVRICAITPSFYPAFVYGGTIVSTYHTYEHLAGLGYEVFVATTNANGETRLEVEVNRYIPLKDHFLVKYYQDTIIGRFSWKFIVSVWRDIRNCDIVRVEDIFSTYIPPSLFFARLFRKPTLISSRGALSEWALRNKRRWLKKVWIKCAFA